MPCDWSTLAEECLVDASPCPTRKVASLFLPPSSAQIAQFNLGTALSCPLQPRLRTANPSLIRRPTSSSLISTPTAHSSPTTSNLATSATTTPARLPCLPAAHSVVPAAPVRPCTQPGLVPHSTSEAAKIHRPFHDASPRA